jgi:hypothetical protein
VIGLITDCLVDVVAVMGDVFILVYNFHVLLALKVGCPSSGVGCEKQRIRCQLSNPS